ncbi:hypothetical protein HMPREF9123_0958 [Neisseria bacilliformis ATCC BAA-1200]|uniref:Uncharacterized protein n=1 Tax=Neisseria bacilliformis ATCC BAA-1200 TaxID=888742 RepID=F2BB54_9NEIS|nr:hypothetical protein HMPREF9123_0958 [Neisseria bacilliformis ATCC BAA-1200]
MSLTRQMPFYGVKAAATVDCQQTLVKPPFFRRPQRCTEAV